MFVPFITIGLGAHLGFMAPIQLSNPDFFWPKNPIKPAPKIPIFFLSNEAAKCIHRRGWKFCNRSNVAFTPYGWHGTILRNTDWFILPIGSMYGIFTYIWLMFMVNAGKYTIYGSYGILTEKVFGVSPSSVIIGTLSAILVFINSTRSI